MQGYSEDTIKAIAATIAFAFSLAAAGPALADDTGAAGVRYDSVVVDYADLDLTSEAGNKVLYARLEAAAEQACGNAPEARDLDRQLKFNACRDEALARALDKLASDSGLQALHATRSSRKSG